MSGVVLMAPRLNDILASKEASNGTRALLEEIRTHQKDMPQECKDDMTFGALVVLYDLGKTRSQQIESLQLLNVLIFVILLGLGATIVALHGNIPWLQNLFEGFGLL